MTFLAFELKLIFKARKDMIILHMEINKISNTLIFFGFKKKNSVKLTSL